MRRLHNRPVTEAVALDALEADLADARSFAESTRYAEGVDEMHAVAAELEEARNGWGVPAAAVSVEPAPRLRYIVAVLVALAAAVIVLAPLTPTPAHAVQLEPADRKVDTVRVAYVEQVSDRQIFVELNNGAAYRLNPCRVEDGRHCFWDAGSAGNGVGRSFVAVAGRVIYTTKLK